MNIGDRVTMPEHPFLSDGVIIKVVSSMLGGKLYIVKLDEKAPNNYAYETDEVLMFPKDIELVN